MRQAAPQPAGPIVVALALVGLAIVVWLPRGLDLDRAVTPDESIWLARSANFYQALTDGDLDRTFQYAHPGVTTMWAGAIAYRLELPAYAKFGPDSIRPWSNAILPVLEEEGADPLRILAACRAVIVVFTTLGMVAFGWYAIRLFGLGVGLLGAALLALDPFHVALSQLLHVDALVSVLAAIAAAAWLSYLLRGRLRRDLIVAGVALGLAGLTRSTAMVVLPMMAVSAVVEGGMAGLPKTSARGWLRRFRPLLTVGIIALLTVAIGWPAMWTSPVDTVGKVISGTLNLSEQAHARPIFFDGRVFDGVDPGILFYPTALLWRATPALMIGLAVATVATLTALPVLIRGVGRVSPPARAAAYLALLAVCVVLLLSASEKKLDRYIVLAFPSLALVAAWGLGAGGRAVLRWTASLGVRLPAAAMAVPAALLLAGTAVETIAVHPYPLSYYNTLLGGADAAKDVMMIGGGEGFDQIAHALDGLPDAADQMIVTSAWEGPITFFTDVASIRGVDLTAPSGVGTWLLADYYVWDVTSDQRGAVPAMIQRHIAGLAPVTSVRLNGVTYAAIYDLRSGGIPADLAEASIPIDGGDDLRLVTTILPTEPVTAGSRLTALLYLSGEVEGDRRVPLRVALIDANGRERGATDFGFVRPDDAGTVFTIRRRIDIPTYIPAGPHQVVARFGDPEDPTTIVLGTVVITRPP